MHHIHKYVYKNSKGLVLSDSRPGGTQWDHVTSYALFKETLRNLETEDPLGTIKRLVGLIVNMRDNHSIFLAKQQGQGASLQTFTSWTSRRNLLKHAKHELVQAELNEQSAKTKLADADFKVRGRGRTQEDKDNLDVARGELIAASLNVKEKRKALAVASSNIPPMDEIDFSVDEIIGQIELLKSSISPNNEIQKAVGVQNSEVGRQRTLNTMRKGNQASFDEVITKLANAYLILRNKQNFSSFPRWHGAKPPSDESEQVRKALVTLREFEAVVSPSASKVTKAVAAMRALFWYPRIPTADLVGNDPEKSQAFRAAYPGKVEPRTNDIEITKLVVSEHLQTVFTCYPQIYLSVQNNMAIEFIGVIAKEWTLSGVAARNFEAEITDFYRHDSQHSASPSDGDSFSGSEADTSDHGETNESRSAEVSDGELDNGGMPSINISDVTYDLDQQAASLTKPSLLAQDRLHALHDSQYEGGDNNDDDSEFDPDYIEGEEENEQESESIFNKVVAKFTGYSSSKTALESELTLSANVEKPLSSSRLTVALPNRSSSNPSSSSGNKRKRSKEADTGVSNSKEGGHIKNP